MNFKKAVLVTAMGATVVGAAPATFALTAGSYDLVILTTPIYTTSKGKTSFSFGSDGAWNSSFTFSTLPGGGSQAMTDNATLVNGNGSGVVDGFGGEIAVTLNGDGTITGPSSFSGTWTAGGVLTLTPTGRLGTVGDFPALVDERWDVDDADEASCTSTGCNTNGNNAYNSFSTGSASNGAGTINGTALSSIADVDGDTVADWAGVIVSGGTVGSDWGGFLGAQYFENWNIQLRSAAEAPAGFFSVDTIFGTAGGEFAQYLPAAPPIPVPAAVWLFGSGLLGLVGVARRKTK